MGRRLFGRGATKSVTGSGSCRTATETVLLPVRRELLLDRNAAAGH